MYFTDEKQHLLASNLNYLMRKKNLTNTGLQEACYGESDRNGTIIARLRGGARRFTMDDVLSLSKVLEVTLETFTEIDLEGLEEAKIDVAEGLLMRPHENPKEIHYRYLEIRGFRLVPFISFLALLLTLLIGCGLSFLSSQVAKYVIISATTMLLLYIIIYLAYGAVTLNCSIREFSLPDTVSYSFINRKPKRRRFYTVLGISMCLIYILLAGAMIYKNMLDGRIVSAVLLDLIILTIIPVILFHKKEAKYLFQIPYYLYVAEQIRRFSVMVFAISLGFALYLLNLSGEIMVIIALYLSGIGILSEFMNRHITHYYMGYAGREEE